MLSVFTKVDQMSRVGSRDRHALLKQSICLVQMIVFFYQMLILVIN